jgi:beta-lactamase regulating signal transducer with metallopeptidase domain
MTSAINLHAVAQFSAERMLNCIVEGVAIALFAWLLLRVIGLQNLGRQNSGTRFAVWLVTLFAIAALPFMGAVVPAGTTGSAGFSQSAIVVPGSWATYLFAVWAVIASWGLLQVGVGLWHVRRVRRNCVAIDTANLDPVLQMTLNDFRSVRPVKICVSDSLQVPTAIGFIEPVVALPAWTFQELSPTELNAILLHELAHLRRWDDWTNLAQKLLRAIFFFHPAVWWIEGKLSLEREMACDDAVLAQTANPRAYAQCLVAVAEKTFMRRGLAMAQAAVSRVRQTSQRVAQILDAKRPGATRVWKPALGMVGAFAMICVGLLSRSPELVSFQDRAPRVESASTVALKSMSAAIQPTKVVRAKFNSRVVAVHPIKVSPANLAPLNRAVEPKTFESDEAVMNQPQPSAVPVNFVLPTNHRGNELSSNKPQPRLKSVLLVYQGLEYDDAGFAHWTICVWRVTVPAEQQAIPVNPPKST